MGPTGAGSTPQKAIWRRLPPARHAFALGGAAAARRFAGPAPGMSVAGSARLPPIQEAPTAPRGRASAVAPDAARRVSALSRHSCAARARMRASYSGSRPISAASRLRGLPRNCSDNRPLVSPPARVSSLARLRRRLATRGRPGASRVSCNRPGVLSLAPAYTRPLLSPRRLP